MAGYIGDIDATLPDDNESINKGDDRIRDLAGKTYDSFPNVTGAVTLTHTELNNSLQGLESDGTTLNTTNSSNDGVAIADLINADAVIKNTAALAPEPEQQMVDTALRITPDSTQDAGLTLDGGGLAATKPVLKLQTASGGSDYGLQADSDFTVAAVRGNGQGAASSNHCLIGHTMSATTGGMRSTLHSSGSGPGADGWYIEFGILSGSTWVPYLQLAVTGADEGKAWLDSVPL